MNSGCQCVWFKRDLRVRDHAPLRKAAECGPVLPVYIIEPEVVDAADFDALHWNFIRESLFELQVSLREWGAELQIIQGSPLEVLQRLHNRYSIEALWAHEETGNDITYKRDIEVRKWAEKVGVLLNEIPQNGVIRRLKDRDGWAREWERRIAEPILEPPESISPVEEFSQSQISSAQELGLSESHREVDLIGGESQAHRVLESFTAERGHRYHREMSSPNTAYGSCSRLSPYLAWGCISMRTVVQSVRRAGGESMPKVAARAFLSRCHWHCHFMQKLESEPGIEFRAFNRACDTLRHEDVDTKRLEALKSGRTGYPFVDACIRSLKTRGWINFRMRAMLVSFASYHLWLDWRHFKDWLACQFIDYEPGIHISQVQMQSGLTGINTLRIYNPTKQGKDHDPDGSFIRNWVPELRGVASEAIHEPWKMPDLIQIDSNCRLGVDYPYPVVDHKEAVAFARAQFSALRQQNEYWDAACEVMIRHGSRKTRESQNRPKRAKRKSSAQIEMNLDDNER